MKKIILLFSSVISLSSTLSLAGQPKQLNEQIQIEEEFRCLEEILSNQDVFDKLTWGLNNGYISKGTFYKFTNEVNDEGEDIKRKNYLYPIWLIHDREGPNGGNTIWQPDLSSSNLPNNVYWGATCEAYANNADKACAKARYNEYNKGLINGNEFEEYSYTNFGPMYNEAKNSSSGIQGWAKCSLVYRQLENK